MSRDAWGGDQAPPLSFGGHWLYPVRHSLLLLMTPLGYVLSSQHVVLVGRSAKVSYQGHIGQARPVSLLKIKHCVEWQKNRDGWNRFHHPPNSLPASPALCPLFIVKLPRLSFCCWQPNPTCYIAVHASHKFCKSSLMFTKSTLRERQTRRTYTEKLIL